MPYRIERHGSGYYVIKSSTGEKKNKKPYSSKQEAMPYLHALYAAESGAKMGKKPTK